MVRTCEDTHIPSSLPMILTAGGGSPNKELVNLCQHINCRTNIEAISAIDKMTVIIPKKTMMYMITRPALPPLRRPKEATLPLKLIIENCNESAF